MICGFCGQDFDGEEAKSFCQGCVMNVSCKKIKCPNCGYEMPREPAWLKKIFKGKSGK
jgi:hypothetical protein